MSETPVNMGFTEAPPTPSAPSPAAAPSSPSPYARDVQRVAEGRTEIEGIRTEAARRRQTGEPPLQLGQNPDAGPVPADAIDGTALRVGESVKLRGEDGKEFSLNASDIERLMAQHATDLQRRANMPSDPGAHEARLPESFKAPEGTEIRINASDPALADLKQWAHGRGMSR